MRTAARKLALIATLAASSLVALGALAPRVEAQEDWRPPRTWVFAVGILEWEDAASFAPFHKEDRRDAQLVAALQARGVPAAQVVALYDRDAKTKRVRRELKQLLAKTQPGDSLFLYFAGHGSRDASGAAYFVTHDAQGGELEQSAWSVRSIFDALEEGFRGDRAWLTADCCYSGALALEAERRASGRIAYACLTSSLSNVPSTGRWTFTECLLAGLQGEPYVDRDGDGTLMLAELAEHTRADLAFADEQYAAFTTTGALKAGLRLGAAKPRAHARVGERLQAEWKGSWWPVRVIGVDGERVQIHYMGWESKWDEWVAPERVRPYRPQAFPKGAAVEVEWKGEWFPAKVQRVWEGLHFIRYDGYGETWDEWVGSKRVRKPAGR